MRYCGNENLRLMLRQPEKTPAGEGVKKKMWVVLVHVA